MSKERWRAEKREGTILPERPVLQKLMDTWWLTDGIESFRMTNEFAARTLAAYLNRNSEEATHP